MVCKKCEKKLHKSVVPEVWKEGSRNADVGKGREVGKNMAASKSQLKSNRVTPYSKFVKCKLCKQQLHQQGNYCQACAYKKGICSMCGVKVLDVSFYKQSS